MYKLSIRPLQCQDNFIKVSLAMLRLRDYYNTLLTLYSPVGSLAFKDDINKISDISKRPIANWLSTLLFM